MPTKKYQATTPAEITATRINTLRMEEWFLFERVCIEADAMYVMKAIKQGLIPEKTPAENTTAAVPRSRRGVIENKPLPVWFDVEKVSSAFSRLVRVRFSP